MIKRKQARIWTKLQRAEARLPTGDAAQRNHALDRIYADLVANSSLGSFASSERSRQPIGTKIARDVLDWLGEQRRLERALFNAKMRSAGLRLFAPLQDVGILIRVGRLIGHRQVIIVCDCPDYNPHDAGSADDGQAQRGLVVLLTSNSSDS